ncbi:hypothetical protein LWI29_006552 [Acer saccharum]|uniref:Uncharacterized protein n=1 Tax=Acer saccharum TaxID=4024 RepID=A0AA39SXH5_ACESA|nr:hypothetical protein LWI29_006552 [Acer saccharum]
MFYNNFIFWTDVSPLLQHQLEELRRQNLPDGETSEDNKRRMFVWNHSRHSEVLAMSHQLIPQNTQGANQGGYNRGTYQGQGSNSQPQQWNNAANRDSTTYQPKKRSLEEIVTSLAENTERFSRDTNQRINNVEASIKNLETQMGQIVDAVRKNEPGRFPSQSEQAKALTVLRSGRVLDTEVVRGQQKEGTRGSEEVSEKETNAEEEVVVETPKKTSVLHKSSDPYVPPPPYVPPIPFPGRLKRDKLSKAFKEIFDVLSKVVLVQFYRRNFLPS